MITTYRSIDAHAGGAGLRLIVHGLPVAPGATLAEKTDWIRPRTAAMRQALLAEPRGHTDLTGAVLTEPVSEEAHAGVVFLHATEVGGFCGHGLIAAATIAAERGLVTTREPHPTRLVFDTAAGPTPITLTWSRGDGGGRITRVSYRAAPSFVVAGGVVLPGDARGVRADLVDAGGLFAVVDSEMLGVPVTVNAIPELRRASRRVLESLSALPMVRRYERGPGPGIEGVVFTSPSDREGADLRSVTVYRGGAVDRSPSGAGTAAVVTLLSAIGLVDEDRPLVHEGLAGASFEGRIAEQVSVGDVPAVVAEISGRAWLTGDHTFFIDDDDPLASRILDDSAPGLS